MTKLKALLTLDEAATYLAVSKTTLRRWTNDGRFACHRVGPRSERRFDPDVLDMFVSTGGSETPDLRAPTISGLSSGAKDSEADLGSRHICLFFGRHEERWEAFRPFFLKHFYAGKPTVYIHSASTREEIMDRVRDEGLDPQRAQPPRTPHFDPRARRLFEEPDVHARVHGCVHASPDHQEAGRQSSVASSRR